MKKKIIIVVIALSIVLGFLFFNRKSNSSNLKNFSKTEIAWIETLSENDKNYFLENENLYPLIKQKSFQVAKFAKYLDFYKTHNDLKFDVLIMIVNHDLQEEKIEITENIMEFFENKSFEPSRLQRYIAYKQENFTLDISKVISFVNQDIDMITMKYNETIDEFFNDRYFIKENLSRYIKYQNEHNTKIDTTVSYVNSNLDYDYYTNTKDADLNKGELILVNKYYMLDKDYEPDNMVQINSKYGISQYLQKDAYNAFTEMADEAKKQGLTLYITSPYRSYQTQSKLYNNYSARDGALLADTYSARPGYSEHQTGLAVDIVSGPGKSLGSFENTDEFKWIKKYAHEYGFILRYPKGKEKLTGYQYEPWHYRYLGVENATKVYTSGLTYDEYYAYYIR